MKTFRMIRHADESGVSGVGNVVEGVEFSDGTVVARWTTITPSTAVYEDIQDFLNIHVLAHPSNLTEIRWDGGAVWSQEEGFPERINQTHPGLPRPSEGCMEWNSRV